MNWKEHIQAPDSKPTPPQTAPDSSALASDTEHQNLFCSWTTLSKVQVDHFKPPSSLVWGIQLSYSHLSQAQQKRKTVVCFLLASQISLVSSSHAAACSILPATLQKLYSARGNIIWNNQTPIFSALPHHFCPLLKAKGWWTQLFPLMREEAQQYIKDAQNKQQSKNSKALQN